jgi:pilus assembly protein Flp/PilA
MRFTFWPTIDRAAMTAGWKSLWYDESGQDLIEYALVAGLIGLGAVIAMSGLATKIKLAFNTVGNNLTNAL